MNEHKGEQTSGETGVAGPAAPDSSQMPAEPATASVQGSAEGSAEPAHVDSPDLVPGRSDPNGDDQEDPLKILLDKVDADQPYAPKAVAAAAAKAEATATDAPRNSGRIMVLSAGERPWGNDDASSTRESERSFGMFGKRRLGALAAVVALAAVAGALGGAMATASFGRLVASESTASVVNRGLETAIARLDADVQALKAGADHAAKLGMVQVNKTNERLDKVEKAQQEPAAKLAKLSEAVEKLHAAPQVAAAPATAPATTGSISPPPAAPKAEVARLPTVEGWSLRDVANGGALIESRQGIFEVYAGDPVPGLGRIDAIRRQDGRWVVVTSRGLIVAR